MGIRTTHRDVLRRQGPRADPRGREKEQLLDGYRKIVQQVQKVFTSIFFLLRLLLHLEFIPCLLHYLDGVEASVSVLEHPSQKLVLCSGLWLAGPLT